METSQADARSGSTQIQALPAQLESYSFYRVVLKGDSNNSQATFMTEKEKKKVFHQLLQLLFQKVLLEKDQH